MDLYRSAKIALGNRFPFCNLVSGNSQRSNGEGLDYAICFGPIIRFLFGEKRHPHVLTHFKVLG